MENVMDREALERANQALLQRRKQEKRRQPSRLTEVTIEEVITGHPAKSEAERAYWRNLKDNKPTDTPKHIIETSRSKWDLFNSDRHPDLQKAVKTIVKWTHEQAGQGGLLILAGNFGSGKTHLAEALKEVYGPKAVYFNEVRLFRLLQRNFKNELETARIINSIYRAPILIFDDLGTYQIKGEDSLAWVQNLYYDFFDHRYEENKATVVTTNLDDSEDELEDRIGERVYSRLIGSLNQPEYYIDLFDVPDYRQRNFA